MRDFQELEFQTSTQVESGSRFILRRKGRATAAGPRGVGIAEFETAAIKTADKVDDRAGEIWSAGAIHINLDAVHLQNQVLRFWLFVKIQLVRITGTSAVSHRNAQSIAFASVARQEFFDLFGGVFCEG
jgi:hypothetical protein